MKPCLLVWCAGLCGLAACSAPDTPASAPPAHSQPAVAAGPLQADYQRLTAERRRARAADSVMNADHQMACAVARDAGLAATPAYKSLEKQHIFLLTRHRQAQQRHDSLLEHYARLGYFSAAPKLPPARLGAAQDSLRAERQHLQAEYRSILADHQQMQAEHAALLETTR